MAHVIVDATITMKEQADRDALVVASVALQEATRHEPGCVAYCFAADPVVAERVQVFERWESEDALDAHLHHENYHAMLNLIMTSAVASAESEKHRIERSAPVYGDDGRPTGHFAS